MRSLYFAILLAMLTILSLSFAAFEVISGLMEKNYFFPVFDTVDEMEVQDARNKLDMGGSPALSAYLERLDRLFGGHHYLLDARGTDLVAGSDRSNLLPKPPLSKSRGQVNGQVLVTHRSTDERCWIVTVAPLQPHGTPFYPYYLLVVAASGALCWLAAAGVVSPIRKIAATVDKFGQGALSARVNIRRRDEIGTLARSFNSMAERLQRLLTSERRLLEDISHELRSPLARLNFSVKLARTAPDREAAFDRIKRDVDRITALVSEIVEMTRLEGDPGSRRSEPATLSEIVSETVRDCSLDAAARVCTLRVDGTLTGKVMGDRELLRRAVENVLRNAIRYSPQNTAVDVVLKEHEDTATIAIRDYGPGVPEDLLARIFDPFFRVEEARDSESGGVGLGLSIAKRAIQWHRGTITAENAAPGLRVQITLPLTHVPAW